MRQRLMRQRLMRLAPLALLAASACTSTSGADLATSTTTSAPTSTTTAPRATSSLTLGTEGRPAQLVAPAEVTGLAPLVVLLHGYGSTAERHDRYLGVTEQAATRGLYVLLPNGTAEASGKQFWDATTACCNFTGTGVDDVGYLRGLIDEAVAKRPIDPKRVYVLGHSNGGFMAYRLACEIADKVTAIAVLAGSDLPRAGQCTPSRPVSVLHLHGTADPLVAYAGGRFTDTFPGALEVMARWAARDGCAPTPTAGPTLDLDGGLPGAETKVTTYDGCDAGIDVQLDSIVGGVHSPDLIHAAVGTDVLDWLLAHTR